MSKLRTFEGYVDDDDYYSVYLRDKPRVREGIGSWFPSDSASVKLDNCVEGCSGKKVRVIVEILEDA